MCHRRCPLIAPAFGIHDITDAFTPDNGRDLTGCEDGTESPVGDAPELAHVKRTAQENFGPKAFLLHRTRPCAEGNECGLVFAAFGCSFDAFEAQLHRMSGAEDGIVDALFTFTEPETGAYFCCPPVADGWVDPQAVGL